MHVMQAKLIGVEAPTGTVRARYFPSEESLWLTLRGSSPHTG